MTSAPTIFTSQGRYDVPPSSPLHVPEDVPLEIGSVSQRSAQEVRLTVDGTDYISDHLWKANVN